MPKLGVRTIGGKLSGTAFFFPSAMPNPRVQRHDNEPHVYHARVNKTNHVPQLANNKHL